MISPGDVRPGKCFLSTGSSPIVLRVRSVREGLVDFERISQKGRAREALGQAPLPEFLSGLKREVGCDFRLDSDPASRG